MRFFARTLMICAFFINLTTQVMAGGYIRDAEIENLLRDYTNPILLAAGLSPNKVKIGLIDDRRINAFVAGGQNIYVHTGLILEADSPNMVIGVMAHETGHITGGHLARMREAMENASRPAILATILGIGAIAAGQADAGMAILSGGTQIAQRSFLTYSRAQESAADQVAIDLLARTQQSPKGIRDLMDHLADQEILSEVNQDPYIRSHPISRDRANFYQNAMDNSPYGGVQDDPELVKRHKLAQAKIYGFLDHPRNTFRRYGDQTNTPALYAKAIAYHKQSKLSQAIELIDKLIARQADNPYFHELKGQILFEGGKPMAAIAPYRQSLALAPDEALLQIGLATALVATEQSDHVAEAIQILNQAIKYDPQNTTAYYQLSLAYGLSNEPGFAELATAEQFYLYGASAKASIHAKRAEKLLKKGSPSWLRAKDILNAAKEEKSR